MKKLRVILPLFVLTAAMLLITTALAAEEGTWGQLSWTLDDEGLLTVSGEGPMDDFESNYSYEAWQNYYYSISALRIEEGVTSVGKYAFEVFNLRRIELPASLTEMDENPFRYSSSLEEIVVAEENPSYMVVGGVLFNRAGTVLIKYPNAKSDTDYDIPAGVTRIGKYAFFRCSNLESVSFPEGLTQIGDGAFYDSYNLTLSQLPDSLVSIGENAFNGCTADVFFIPANVREIRASSIPDYCQSGIAVSPENPWLTAENNILFSKDKTELIYYFRWKEDAVYTVPSGVQVIREEAFQSCRNLTRVNLPDSLVRIGDGAFAYMYNLVSMAVPAGVTAMGEDAFRRCEKLASVTLPAGIGIIGNWSFEGCLALTSVEIPSTVKEIGFSAFRECSRLTSVSLPGALKTIGKAAFYGCIKLREVRVPAGTATQQWLFYGCALDLPATVTDVGYAAFSITDVGEKITADITLPENEEEELIIGDEAFRGIDAACVDLEDVASVGSKAFAYCPNLRYVYIGWDPQLAEDAFEGCSNLVFFADRNCRPEILEYAERNNIRVIEDEYYSEG